MMRGTVVVAIVAALAGNAHAQQASSTQPAPAAQEKPAPRPAPPEGQPNNIKVELSITDQAGNGAPSKRTVSMIIADRSSGSVRSQGAPIGGARTAILNVDATPIIVKDGLMRVQLGLEYFPRPGDGPVPNEGQGSLNQRLTLLVESGKPMIVSQASDPTSDRKMIVELTGTILK
jgi:hypothetical protein